MLDDMKTGIPRSLAMQIDTMKLKMRKEKGKKALSVFCPHC